MLVAWIHHAPTRGESLPKLRDLIILCRDSVPCRRELGVCLFQKIFEPRDLHVSQAD